VVCSQLGSCDTAKSWVPLPECGLKIIVEHVGPHLQKQVRTAWRPAHLLFLDESFGEQLNNEIAAREALAKAEEESVKRKDF
jgi:hypothetical protein